MVRGIYNPVTHQRRPPDEFLHVSSKALLLPQRLRRKTLWGLGVRRTRAAHGIWAVNNVNKDGFLGKIWKEWTSLCVFFPQKKVVAESIPATNTGWCAVGPNHWFSTWIFNYIPPYARLPTWMRGKIIEKHQLFWCTFLASDFELGTWLWRPKNLDTNRIAVPQKSARFAHFLMVHLGGDMGVELWPKSCVFCWPRLYPLSPRCHGPSGFYPKSCTPQIWFRWPNFAIRHILVDWALGVLPGLLGITIPPFSRETLHQLAWDGRWFFSWLT